jgi:uncharacterized protein YpmS
MRGEPVSTVITRTHPPVSHRLKLIVLPMLLLLLPGISLSLLWVYGPVLVAPQENFVQGPGGAVAYVNLWRQVQAQQAAFWSGQEVEIRIEEAELSGMISSALLSGRAATDPLRKVRTQMIDQQIRVETILHAHDSRVPNRYQGLVGLNLRLQPTVEEDGLVRFQITRTQLGTLPIPIWLIQWLGRYVPADTPHFQAREAAIRFPLSEMIASQLGRSVLVKGLEVRGEELRIRLSLPPNLQKH